MTAGTESQLRADLAEACRILAAEGHEHFDLGHASARSAAVDGFWVKPAGLRLAEVEAADLALNPDGHFNRSGYGGQARIVQGQIDEMAPRAVLELGSGNGFNSLILARSNPSVTFRGIDLTPRHVKAAQRNSKAARNVAFDLGNFQAMPYLGGSFDLVFVVESLCHASDMELALGEARRVLRPKGRLVVIDGFRRSGFEHLAPEVRLAARLSEAAMAVDRPYVFDDWLALARREGYVVLGTEDLTPAIMPNLLRLQWLARGFFKYRLLARLFLTVLPQDLVRNSIAGLLMPILTTAGAQGYWSTILERT